MKTVYVNLPASAYEVKVGESILQESLKNILQNLDSKKVFVVTNETLQEIYPDHIRSLLPEEYDVRQIILPDGEQYKNLGTVQRIYDFLMENKANRKTPLISFGGGVIGDMGGFAAATFMRGMPLIQVPTTLLSQVDSSIGGKTGVNHPGGKNSIGVFKQPNQTIIDIHFLKTLPERELIAGYAELLKHGIIRDTYLCQILSQHKVMDLLSDKAFLIDSVFRSCEVKARVVEQDEKESNLRAILNFGHTLAHFIETYTHYNEYLHGEAVIVGMGFATWWSMKKKSLDPDDFKRIHGHLASIGLKVQIPALDEEKFVSIIDRDKKNTETGINFVGLGGVGIARLFSGITPESLWEDFSEYIQREDSLIQIIN